MKLTRRNFISKSSFGLPLLPITFSWNSNLSLKKEKHSPLKEGDVILFQGDSITDSNREKTKELPNDSFSLGSGYAFMGASQLLFSNPNKKLKIYNRGISGNKVFQLDERWEKDCVNLKPDFVSILIGVNDYWHKRDKVYDGTIDVFEKDYRGLLNKTKEQLPLVKFIICEPFILMGSKVDKSWIGPFAEYQKITKKLADEFNSLWVPFQETFNHAVEFAPPSYWAPDGVHPSIAGNQLMANKWLKIINSKE
ncbi:MAG: SGNH/GDSL hydrolase family protein [Flavobacteriaceae bacterium]|nr:SGNH/GDSL hydrolase family protein [Flavobacteriaceae bacterium]